MSPLLAALLAALAALGAAGLVFALARQRAQLRALLELSSQRLENERVKQNAELSAQRANVERVVEKLAEQLKGYEALVRQFDAERREKYGFLDKSLRDASETTGRLAATTEGLRALLDNSRARGQWGERMADDILRASGLKEGVQYLKNRAQDTSATRPDFTFLLPEGHRLHMDVKFPLDNYLRMSGAAAPEERARFKAEFLRDVKARVKEVQKRDYINPAEQTLDYVLLFIPNEQVYGFIHESLPGLIDETLAQKVVLCSPFTLYAVLAVVRQAFDNFHFAQSTQGILKMFGSFMEAYGLFRDRFGRLGEELRKAQGVYDDIEAKSFKRLDQSVAKLERLSKGQDGSPALPGEVVSGKTLSVEKP